MPSRRVIYSVALESGELETNLVRLPCAGGPAYWARAHRHSFAELMARYTYAVYVDSGDPNAVFQVAKWFDGGFLPAKRTVVLFKRYQRSCPAFVDYFTRRGLPFIGLKVFKKLTLDGLDAVFYPYNANTNSILIKKRCTRHIFIGHGESDKWASVNPMFRMYDHIFVAGDSSVDRLREHGIVNSEDIAAGRCVRIGLPYIGSNRELFGEPARSARAGAVYAPTWEGVEPSQQYSSLEAGYGERVVEFLLGHTDEAVVFAPHPSTGQKLPEYGRHARAVVERFGGDPRFSVYVPAGSSLRASMRGELRKARPGVLVDEPPDYDAMRWMFTDVSSMLATALFHRVPSVLIAKQKNGLDAAELARSKGHPLAGLSSFIIPFEEPPEESLAEVFAGCDYQRVSDELEGRCRYVVGVERSEYESLDNGALFERTMGELAGGGAGKKSE